MMTMSAGLSEARAPRVLALGAHCDDIEIGCGGTLQVLAEAHPALELRWIVLSSTEQRAAEARHAVKVLLPGITEPRLDIQAFKDCYFPHFGYEIKDYIESAKRDFAPDLIFTHFEKDRHQDHRVVAEFTRNAYRDHLIFEYEVIKYDGDLASPNMFVPITRAQADRKVNALMSAFESQRNRQWFTPDAFMSVMRLRGVESNSPTGYAEAFHCRKARVLA